MKRILMMLVCFGTVGCASGTANQGKCVQSPEVVVEEPTATGCDNETVVAEKVEVLRKRQAAGELDDEQMYAEHSAVIDGACFKAYLPIVADDMTPMGPGPAMRLRKLKSLLDAGIVTQADYDEKKKSILSGL